MKKYENCAMTTDSSVNRSSTSKGGVFGSLVQIEFDGFDFPSFFTRSDIYLISCLFVDLCNFPNV